MKPFDGAVILGIMGKKEHGKDETAKALQPEFQRFAFADTMKQTFATMTQTDIDPWYNDKNSKMPVYPDVLYREFMQTVAEKVCESYPKIWVAPTITRMKAAYENGQRLFVISDLRKPVEYEELQVHGAFFIRVVNPRKISTDQHYSEIALDNVMPDLVLTNDHPSAALYREYASKTIKNFLANAVDINSLL